MLRMAFASPCLFALCGLIGACVPQAKADAIADFYRARTVTVVVSSSAAGGYDTLARVVARYMGRHLPGNPVFIVRNMPGAGGIAATNFLYNNAEQRWQRHWPCSEQHAIRAALRHQGGTL
ncbi:MAG: hypothetical protein E6G74_08885 [Alphaproteobacteria bacterium]|nr:MAG: hypothetical protein E6G74_08885 [Alphaproteobacteria bacterium]